MKNMADVNLRSRKILVDNITWLLSSDIRIKNGENKGAFYGWKNLNPPSFPFIYSEITGYAVTAFLWLHSEFENQSALKAAIESASWLKRNMHSYLLAARPPSSSNLNNLSDLFYSFDNGMIMIGFLNLYKVTKKPNFLFLAEKMTRMIIEHFFDGTKLIARLDKTLKPIAVNDKRETNKWSVISGAYHCKLSIGLLELSKLTGNKTYSELSDSLCNYAIKLQKPTGEFITNPDSNIIHIHPHLYACEGLIHSGVITANNKHYLAGLNGVKWAIKQANSCKGGGLRSNTLQDSTEQSDCTAQLLRLLILCRTQLGKHYGRTALEKTIDKLHERLLDFYIPTDNGQGGMRYQLNLDSICSWCTMFSVQALGLWQSKGSKNLSWIDYFI